MWLSNPSCEEKVHMAWNCIVDLGVERQILTKLDKCSTNLVWWNQSVFGNVKHELEKKKALLLKAENEAILSGDNNRVRQMNAEINLLLDREARMWAQRS